MTLPPYNGLPKLVLAFDIGTAFSACSFCILEPGAAPVVEHVTSYIGSGHAGPILKVPTIVYYDEHGEIAAIGAEAEIEDVVWRAKENNWSKAEFLKLHLNPPLQHNGKHTFSVPNKTIIKNIEFSRPNEPGLWQSFGGRIEYVITHPNNYDSNEERKLKDAMLATGLLGALPDLSRLHLVTDGEASLHFCLGRDSSSVVITGGKGVLVVDAGSCTVNLSAFHVRSFLPYSLEEISAPQTLTAGSMFVSRAAERHFEEKLRGSQFGDPEDIEELVLEFDKIVKTDFVSIDKPSHIGIGRKRDNDPELGILSGQLEIPGAKMASFFEPSLCDIVQGINKMVKSSKVSISAIYLVGEFAQSQWLYSNLNLRLTHLGLTISRPGQLNKAVAEGAVLFYLNHIMNARDNSQQLYGIIRWVKPTIKHSESVPSLLPGRLQSGPAAERANCHEAPLFPSPPGTRTKYKPRTSEPYPGPSRSFIYETRPEEPIRDAQRPEYEEQMSDSYVKTINEDQEVAHQELVSEPQQLISKEHKQTPREQYREPLKETRGKRWEGPKEELQELLPEQPMELPQEQSEPPTKKRQKTRSVDHLQVDFKEPLTKERPDKEEVSKIVPRRQMSIKKDYFEKGPPKDLEMIFQRYRGHDDSEPDWLDENFAPGWN